MTSGIFRIDISRISIYGYLAQLTDGIPTHSGATRMNTTIDQWEVLEAVVELGSFAAAASKMNRSQSTISYAVSRLQEQFKTPLLGMKGRKAQLTEAGKALLADVEPL